MLFVTIKRPLPTRFALLLAVFFILLAGALGIALFGDRLVLGGNLSSTENERDIPVAGRLQPMRKVETAQKAVALTFDISWGDKTPPLILDVLRGYNVKGTFFLSGPWVSRQPAFVQAIKADGHQIESHGHAHINLSQYPAERIADEIRKADAAISQVSGVKAKYIRPPNGDYNDTVIETASTAGYTVITWGTDSLDWKNPGVEVITKRVLDRAHNGDVILLHASDTCKQTHLALPAIIQGLRDRGFTLLTLDELVETSKK
ncbi:MAG: polysaccharide deacetylase family protein [Bacillota bacterium]